MLARVRTPTHTADETPTGRWRSGPHLDLNLLRTFLAVYRCGSLTAAAPLLGLSQPTVTAQVRALEHRTGRDLFVRLPRGVEPTEAAHDLAGLVGAPLDALAAVEGHDGVLPGRRAAVHLAGPSELLCTRVLPALAPLVVEGVELRVAQGLTEPLLEEFQTGRHDLVVTTRRPRGRALTSYPLADEEYVLVGAPAWAARLAPLVAADGACAYREVPLVAFAEDLPMVRRYWREVFGKRTGVRAAVTVPNLYAVLSALTAGAGLSVLPRSLCRAHLEDGRLVVLHTPAEPPLNTLYLVERPGAAANPDVVRVREAVRGAARGW